MLRKVKALQQCIVIAGFTVVISFLNDIGE